MGNKSHFFRQSSGGGGDAFIATFRTTSANESITLPYPSIGTYSGTIDWGDGTVVANSFANSTHTYTVAGDYDVTILGEFDYGFNGSNASRRKIIDVKQWGNGITILKQAFYDARSLNVTATDILDLGITTDIRELFQLNLSNTFDLSISNWDMSNVEEINSLFQDCQLFNQPLNNWNTSNVTNILRLFLGALLFNQPLNNWDTSNVTTMDRTFSSAMSFNQDISSWNFSGLNNVNSLFRFMFGKSSTNYNSTYYDNLLIKWASDPSLGGLQPNIIRYY